MFIKWIKKQAAKEIIALIDDRIKLHRLIQNQPHRGWSQFQSCQDKIVGLEVLKDSINDKYNLKQA